MPKITEKVLTKKVGENGNEFYSMEEKVKEYPNQITLNYSAYKKGYVLGKIFIPLEDVVSSLAQNEEESITRD